MERSSVARGGGICMAAACAALVLMGGITCDVYGSDVADAAGFRADSDCRIRLQLHLRHDHNDQYPGGGREYGADPDAEPRPPTYNTFVQEPLARPAAADGSEAADVVVGHATGVYLFSHARVGLLYLTAVIDDRGSHGCAAAGSVILMGSLSPRACSFSSSSSSSSSSARPAAAIDKPPGSAQEDHAAAEEGWGALAVVGGTGDFALASGEASVHFAYRHPSSITLHLHLHLHLPTSSIRMPSSTAGAPPHGRVSPIRQQETS